MTAPLHPAPPAGMPVEMRQHPAPVSADTAELAVAATSTPSQRQPLGQVLLQAGHISPADLMRALALQARARVRIGEVLVAHGMVSEEALLDGLARQWNTEVIDLAAMPPDPALIDAVGAAECLRFALVPWRRVGGATVVASARPESLAALLPRLEAALGPVVLAVAAEAAVQEAVTTARGQSLARRAETRTPDAESCRGSGLLHLRRIVLAAALLLALAALLAPVAVLAGLAAWAVLTLAAVTALRIAAAVAAMRERAESPPPWAPAPPEIARLPTVSIMVALHGEQGIAPRLVRRLDRLAYPRELLDVLLVVENDDHATREALEAADLPRWMRVVPVPEGTLRTKPRALNYALDLCRGSIVGVYDAEDAPAPDQILRVVERFHRRGSELGCIQGVLDFANARSNWLARCFTLEYASWFRMQLPGLARLGLVVPLGGTTLFFRRSVLEEIGAWDAHNVTEDADLGLRLARRGYRTELLDTVTDEEANCRPIPWVRQRSRWLKGYAVTYATHMRDPVGLWRDLGAWRFLGVQVLFLGSLSQAVLAPVLWSFWLLPFGVAHPLAALAGSAALMALVVAFLAAHAAQLAIDLVAVSAPRHRHLRRWAPTLYFYHPLATLAAAKALWELVVRPLYWDKTAHGLFDDPAPEPVLRAGAPAAARGAA